MEADTKGQNDAEGMLCAIGLQVAAIVEEILQAGLYVYAKTGRKVILQTYAKCRGELAGNAEGFFILEGAPTIVDVIDISETTYRQLQHEAC